MIKHVLSAAMVMAVLPLAAATRMRIEPPSAFSPTPGIPATGPTANAHRRCRRRALPSPAVRLGLNAEAQGHIRSARLFLREFDIIRAVPDAGHARLGGRARSEAYLTSIGDDAYAVYFPDAGAVQLALPGGREYALRWLDIGAGRWSAATVVGGESVRLEAPGRGHRLALLRSRAPASALTR